MITEILREKPVEWYEWHKSNKYCTGIALRPLWWESSNVLNYGVTSKGITEREPTTFT